MAGTKRTRAQLTTDPGAPFRTGNVPVNQDFQDMAASSYSLLDDAADRIAVDAVTDALWETYYPGELPADASARKLITGLLNRLVTEHNDRTLHIVQSISELRAIRGGTKQAVNALGYYGADDEGGGFFRWDSGSTAADNAGTVILPTGHVGAGRWIRVRNGRPFDPRWFGAKGDGVTDDTTAWLATLAPKRVCDGGGLTYKITSSLTLYSGLTLRETAFDFSAAAVADRMLEATGTIGTASSLTANAAYGTRTITIASTSGFAAEDLVWVASTAVWSTIDSSTYGEIARVRSVDSGTQMTLYQSLANDYTTAASASIAKLTPVDGITLERVRGIGSGVGGQQFGAFFTNCANVQLIDCEFDRFDSRAAEFDRCYRFGTLRGTFNRSTQTGLAYGIVIAQGSRRGVIDKPTGAWLRHLVTIGGTAGVCRHIDVIAAYGENMMDAVVDCHPAGQFIRFIRPTCIGDGGSEATGSHDGITVQGTNVSIEHPTIRHVGRHGILLQPSADGCHTDLSYSIIGGDIDSTGLGGSGGAGITVQPLVAKTITGLRIMAPRIANTPLTAVAAMYIYAAAGRIKGLALVAPSIVDCNTHGIYLRADSTDPAAMGSLSLAALVGEQIGLTASADAASKVPINTLNVRRLVGTGGITESAYGSYYGTGDDEVVLVGNSWSGTTTTDDPNTQATHKIVVGNTRNEDQATSVTISAGEITATSAQIIVDTEASAATDDLVTILPGPYIGVGSTIMLRSANSARDVTLKHAAGNIRLNGQADATLDSIYDQAELTWTGSVWVGLLVNAG